MATSEIETLDVGTATLTLSVDGDLYPRDVVYAAAYVFLDRAYVVLDKLGSRIVVHLRGKQALEEAELRALAGEFENELLAQTLRRRVVKVNQRIIERITNLAIGSAAGAHVPSFALSADPESGLDNGGDRTAEEAEPSTDTVDFLDDPLGIAKPWEPGDPGESGKSGEPEKKEG